MRKLITALLVTTMLSGCATGGGTSSGNEAPGGFCYEHTALCVVGGVVTAGLVAGIIADHNSNDGNGCGPRGAHGACAPSDERLKRDIKPLMTTENGIKIYTFRYIGDDHLFSGAMAQDLLKDPAFADAVSEDANGYYEVDYGKLGIPVLNEDAMVQAGRKAEEMALAGGQQ